jgi:hypothetical protein
MHFIANCRKLVQEKKLFAKVLTNDQAETIKNFLLEDHQKYMKWLKEQKEQSSDDEEDEEESEDDSDEEKEEEEEDGEEEEEDEEEEEEITYRREGKLSSQEYRWVNVYGLSGRKGREELVRRGNTASEEGDSDCRVAR